MIAPQERLKQEFELNLQWSRVDVGAALALQVCQWRSSASEQHAQVWPLRRRFHSPKGCCCCGSTRGRVAPTSSPGFVAKGNYHLITMQ